MANQKDIDKTALAIAEIIDKAKIELIDDVYKIVGKLDTALLIETLKTLDVATILNNKVSKALSAYTIAHQKVLESTVAFAGVNESVLLGLVELNQGIFNESVIRTTASQIKAKIASGVVAGTKPLQIAEAVTSASISNAQVQTLVNTSLNVYSRTVTNEMMNEAPKETKYVYEGAADDRTRDECWDMISAGRLTQEEIISQFGAAVLTDGGCFNCRHKWEIASEVGRETIKERQTVAKEKVNA